MKSCIFVLFILLLSACQRCGVDPHGSVGTLIARAEDCGINTEEFYNLAEDAEVNAVASYRSFGNSKHCSAMWFGGREHFEMRYNDLIRSMHLRRTD